MCTKNHQCLFGEISSYKMYVNNFGNIIINCWEWLTNQYPYIEIDEFVLMPNHIHGIIFIDNEPCRGDSRIAPKHSIKPKTLSRIVDVFKIVSTKKTNQIRKSPGKMLWQRNYYEHIIRNNKSLDQIRQYIINNSLKWDLNH